MHLRSGKNISAEVLIRQPRRAWSVPLDQHQRLAAYWYGAAGESVESAVETSDGGSEDDSSRPSSIGDFEDDEDDDNDEDGADAATEDIEDEDMELSFPRAPGVTPTGIPTFIVILVISVLFGYYVAWSTRADAQARRPVEIINYPSVITTVTVSTATTTTTTKIPAPTCARPNELCPGQLDWAHFPQYYAMVGCDRESPTALKESCIRTNCQRLKLDWHPDKFIHQPDHSSESDHFVLKPHDVARLRYDWRRELHAKIYVGILYACKTLQNQTARDLYDAKGFSVQWVDDGNEFLEALRGLWGRVERGMGMFVKLGPVSRWQ